MKTVIFPKRFPSLNPLLLSILTIFIINPAVLSAQVKVVDGNRIGIGTDTPDPSAKLEIHSTNDPGNPNTFQGFLKPRMTYEQMLSIQNPANGLEVFVTDYDKRKTYWWDDLLQSWVTYCGAGDPFDELQTLLTNNQPGNISISNGNTITINVNDADADPVNELQGIYTDGQPGNISITDGNGITINVDDADANPNNELQTLSLNGNDLTISYGNTVALSGGTVGGTGTRDFIPKWTPDGTHLENSQIHDDGSRISIGTLQPIDASENISLLLRGRLAFEFPDNTTFTKSNIALGYKSGNAGQTGLNNIFIGHLTGNESTSGFMNVMVGSEAGSQNNTGRYNVFLGAEAGYSNTIGSENNFIGQSSGHLNTIGNRNNFFGKAAGYNNTTGRDNNFFGHRAGENNTTGLVNNFVGGQAGFLNTEGSNNNFFGYLAGFNNMTGFRNNFFGNGAGYDNITGDYNNFFGYQAGKSNEIGRYNSFFGHEAGYANTSGGENNFMGWQAGYNNSTGFRNIFIGSRAGFNNTKGNNNICIGHKTGHEHTNGGLNNTYIGQAAGHGQEGYEGDPASNNNFIGYYVGYKITSGDENNFFGNGAGTDNESGSRNSFFGGQTGYKNQSGMYNTFVGYRAGFNNNGNNNIFIGYQAGIENVAGNHNTYVGQETGLGTQNAAYNVFLGYRAGRFEENSYRLHIASTDAGLPLIYGEFDNSILEFNGKSGIRRKPIENDLEVNGNASKAQPGEWLANSDARLKKNITPLSPKETLEQLLRLQGITYEWNDNKTSYERPESIQYGFTAQNVLEVFPTLVSEDSQGYFQTTYGTYDAMYIEAFRALSLQNENLRTERKKDQEKISNLENRLQRLESMVMRQMDTIYNR